MNEPIATGAQKANTIPCHKCLETMTRGVKAIRLNFQGFQTPAFLLPGYYCKNCGEGVITGKDMRISDAHLAELKKRAQSAPPASTH